MVIIFMILIKVLILSNNIEKQINDSIKNDISFSFYINNVNGHSVFKNSDSSATTIHFHKDTTVAKQMTLGWKLGFRKEEIKIEAGKIVESEAVCDLTGPKYMYVVVDVLIILIIIFNLLFQNLY